MFVEQYRDIRVLRKMERESRLLTRDLEAAVAEKREAAVQAATRCHFLDKPITALDTSPSEKLKKSAPSC